MIAGHKGEIPFVMRLLPFLAGISLGTIFLTFLLLHFFLFFFFCLAILLVSFNLVYKQLKPLQDKVDWRHASIPHFIPVRLGGYHRL